MDTTRQQFHDSIINLQPIELLTYQEVIPELQLMSSCAQDPKHHAEGDVLIHVNMALKEVLSRLDQVDSQEDKVILYVATMLHDIGKPNTFAISPRHGRITAYGHDSAGVPIANAFLKKYFPEFNYKTREQILRLIEYHMKPRMMMKDGTTVDKLRLMSLAVNTKLLYLLSQADTQGRTAGDMGNGMVLLELFKQNCEDLGIFGRHYRIPLSHTVDNASYSLARWNILMHNAPENKKTLSEARALMGKPIPHFQLMLMVGAPGSGKSTIVQKLIQQYPNVKVISMDEKRKELCGDMADQSRNEEIFNWAVKELSVAMKSRMNVVFDATNPSRKKRKIFWDIARKNGALCSAVYFDLPLETLLERNAKRERIVPEEVIKHIYNSTQNITPEESDQITIVDC